MRKRRVTPIGAAFVALVLQKASAGNGDPAAHAPAPADGTRATRELSESPAMRAKLLDGMDTPLKDCLPEDEVIW